MTFVFGDCTLDTAARRLICRGQDVHLSPKAFELLSILIANQPRALSKAELLEQVWPGVFVSEASLAKVVSKIREATGAGSDDSSILRTVHGYGYAFTGSVRVDGACEEAGSPARSAVCWLFCGTREFPLYDGEHIIGRDPQASIRLESPRVSRYHAKLVVKGGSATLADLGSKNGSFVRGVRVCGPTLLESGDEARIGPFALIFRVAADSGSTQTEVC